MAASGTMQDLTALEQARARLEAALAGDESWRALQQSAGQAGAEESAARRARNTRLKMALAENPIYQAWKHLGEAIAALRESEARGEPMAGELPADVAALLRGSEARAVSQGGFGSLARRLAVSLPGSDAATDAKPNRDPEKRVPQAAEGPRASQSSPRQRPRAGQAGAKANADPPANPRGRAGSDPDEATVTFVRRTPLLPAAELPADLGTGRASELFERLRAISEEPENSKAALPAAKGSAEEAEVLIVSEESTRARREAEARADTVSRLRKALSGN